MARKRRAPESVERLEKRLGYRFRDPALLTQALTHRSHRGNHGSPDGEGDNERLEFLGDAIVGFVVSDALYMRLPGLREGQLSRIKANLVSARSLRQVAERLELGRYLQLGPGEEKTGGRHKQTILADAVEAVVAALYRDGGVEAARRFVEDTLLEGSNLEPLARADYKSALQEYLQGRRLPAARYLVTATRGPEHRKTFSLELWIGDRRCGRAEGRSKKAAEQQAARQALRKFSREDKVKSA